MSRTFWVLLALAALLSTSASNACVCKWEGLSQEEAVALEVERSRFVVLGRVGTAAWLSSATDERTAIIGGVEVLEVLKSEGATPLIVEMRLSQLGERNSCTSPPFAWLGDYMLLYLDELLVTEKLFHACSRSTIVSEPGQVDAELAVIRTRGR